MEDNGDHSALPSLILGPRDGEEARWRPEIEPGDTLNTGSHYQIPGGSYGF